MKWCSRTLVSNPYHLGLCLSEKKFAKELKRMGITEPQPFVRSHTANATAHYFIDGRGGYSIIVTMRDYKGKDKIAIYGLLLHEAVHVWQEIKEHIGEREPSREFEAYSIQMIAQQLMWAFKELAG